MLVSAIVQNAGQTCSAGSRVLIDKAIYEPLLDRLGYQAPPYASASTPEEAIERASEVGFPLLVRPSYVLGGRAMEIVYDVDGLRDYLSRVAPEPGTTIYQSHPTATTTTTVVFYPDGSGMKYLSTELWT